MSPDQNPEVPTEEPAQTPLNAPKPEWPKKIRTLSAAELDRLTIDSEGRFYWDGQQVVPPVVQAPPPPAADETTSSGPVDLDALALLDRAARELSGQQHPGTEPTVMAPGADAYHEPHGEVHIGESTAVAPLHVVETVPAPAYDMTYRMPTEKVRLRMSFLQSLALVLLVVGVLVGAVGIAISGLVSAHDWACRVNLVKQYCPPAPPAPKPPANTDIPA